MALVLAGGTGSRLRPLTDTSAKQLIPVANRPIIDYVLDDLRNAGVTEVVVIVGSETQADISAAVGDGSQWGLNVQYVYQDKPLGLAHCIKLAKSALRGGAFVMYLGDNMVKNGITKFADQFRSGSADALVLFSKVPNACEFGVGDFSESGRLIRVVEKPENPPSDMALTGVYFFSDKVFEAVDNIEPSHRNELEVTDAIQWLLDSGADVEHANITGWWKDTGKPEDVLEANRLILSGITTSIHADSYVDSTSRVIGEVRLEADVVVENSVLRGPVVIGSGCRIVNSTVGPFTSIGSNCEIRSTEISYSVVMSASRVLGVLERVDWSLIGREALIERAEGRPKGLNLIVGDRSYVGFP